jgi:hypothetical protein
MCTFQFFDELTIFASKIAEGFAKACVKIFRICEFSYSEVTKVIVVCKHLLIAIKLEVFNFNLI